MSLDSLAACEAVSLPRRRLARCFHLSWRLMQRSERVRECAMCALLFMPESHGSNLLAVERRERPERQSSEDAGVRKNERRSRMVWCGRGGGETRANILQMRTPYRVGDSL